MDWGQGFEDTGGDTEAKSLRIYTVCKCPCRSHDEWECKIGENAVPWRTQRGSWLFSLLFLALTSPYYILLNEWDWVKSTLLLLDNRHFSYLWQKIRVTRIHHHICLLMEDMAMTAFTLGLSFFVWPKAVSSHLPISWKMVGDEICCRILLLKIFWIIPTV